MQMSTKVYMGVGGFQKVQKLIYVVYGWHLLWIVKNINEDRHDFQENFSSRLEFSKKKFHLENAVKLYYSRRQTLVPYI